MKDGLFLVGQFVGIEPAGKFRGRDGAEHESGPAVKVLAGKGLHTVRFKDDEALSAAVPELGKLVKLDAITVPVWARGPFVENGEPVRVTLRGRVPEGDAA